MRQLNAQVDIEQEDPDEVAAEFLQEKGIVE
jgi:glycine betaine/choline ABC-type transport system substrate-binding protein